MKRIMIAEIVLMIMFSYCLETFSEKVSDAEQKAKEIRHIAASDMIYTQEKIKALYYQTED